MDPRRRIPRTDALLARPRVAAAAEALGAGVVKGLVRAVQDRARSGEIAPEAVEAELLTALDARRPASLTPVINATGVIVHTNLGRASLSEAARAAVAEASGYTDLEFDLATGKRGRRGTGVRAALLEACPEAEDALVVNNGAAALLLAVTALAGRAADTRFSAQTPRATPPYGSPAPRSHGSPSPRSEPSEVLLSRGEFVEIGAGFRLSDLMESAGARLREVGTTNRTHVDDYARALSPATGCVLKVHTSNFRVEGFTAEADLAELSALAHAHGVPLVVDLGSGLLEPEAVLPGEPDAATALAAGADLVIASGDKLLGGPQAGILLGRAEVVAALGRHPLARALRADKLALAALEATVTAGEAPVTRALRADPELLRERTLALARELAAAVPAAPQQSSIVVPHDGRVGGGGGTGVPLPGWALALPEAVAGPLRTGTPAVVGRMHEGRCLIDLRCVPESQDGELLRALIAALDATGSAGGLR
ncbi:L-seryl-tRNA(Sec) selenium transferase [Brevibacterium album]|uniref:L-seryl-tRNA(Sec) selenium transferase n=1 Tax=Brevibacterium album TaxID=417948 RepID=UPI00042416C6|nr:L-seryl-tRNA(Sec) selenium transferase [Brevibacterium album]